MLRDKVFAANASSTPVTISNTAWGWGCNGQGRLGDNTTVNKFSPVSVVGGFCDWYQVGAGGAHSLGLRQNNQIWAWGCNSSGQLGNNSTVSRSSPVQVVGGFTDWCQIGAGCDHSLAVRQNGTAWAWGTNDLGRLGDNTTANKSSPVSVVGGFTNWCQVSGGRYHSLGVRTNGTSWAWGCNSCGRLGDGTIVAKSSPVSVVGGFTDWCQVSAGYEQSLGVRTNGTAWAWGRNQLGQLGTNNTTDRSSPVQVVGGFTNWCQVSSSRYQSLGVRTNGTAWAWGGNNLGNLGDNTTVSKSSPVSVVGGFTDWCQVSTAPFGGGPTSAAVRQNGTAWTWGWNNTGKLGDNTQTNRSSPVSVVGGFTDWCQISAGANHSLAIRCTV